MFRKAAVRLGDCFFSVILLIAKIHLVSFILCVLHFTCTSNRRRRNVANAAPRNVAPPPLLGPTARRRRRANVERTLRLSIKEPASERDLQELNFSRMSILQSETESRHAGEGGAPNSATPKSIPRVGDGKLPKDDELRKRLRTASIGDDNTAASSVDESRHPSCRLRTETASPISRLLQQIDVSESEKESESSQESSASKESETEESSSTSDRSEESETKSTTTSKKERKRSSRGQSEQKTRSSEKAPADAKASAAAKITEAEIKEKGPEPESKPPAPESSDEKDDEEKEEETPKKRLSGYALQTSSTAGLTKGSGYFADASPKKQKSKDSRKISPKVVPSSLPVSSVSRAPSEGSSGAAEPIPSQTPTPKEVPVSDAPQAVPVSSAPQAVPVSSAPQAVPVSSDASMTGTSDTSGAQGANTAPVGSPSASASQPLPAFVAQVPPAKRSVSVVTGRTCVIM